MKLKCLTTTTIASEHQPSDGDDSRSSYTVESFLSYKYVLSNGLEDSLNPRPSLWKFLLWGGAVYVGLIVHWFPLCIARRGRRKCREECGEVWHGHTCRFMLPLGVPLGEILYNSPQAMDFPIVVMRDVEFPNGSRGMRQFTPTSLELGDDSLQNKTRTSLWWRWSTKRMPYTSGCIATLLKELRNINYWGSERVGILPREACQSRSQTLLTIVALTQLQFKLELEENIFVYNP